ncbi:MAG: RimK/LysX family protein [Chloroflexota bacterium]|nr:RimK/LysX family protein [Chloroflexota bacterium]
MTSQDVKGQRPPLRSVMAPLAFLAGLLVVGLTILFITPDEEDPTDEPVVVGRVEWIELHNPEARNRVEVRAKVDTGAESSSIDTTLAQQLGFDLEKADKITVRSALGREERPVINMPIRVAGRRIETRVTVNDRSNLDYPVLLGARDLQGFLVDTTSEKLTTPRGKELPGTTAGKHRSPILTSSTRQLLAPIPLAAALVVGLRTMVGMVTFGVFAPILLGLALAHTGVFSGVVTFGAMLGTGILVQLLTRRFKLPRIARLAVLLCAVVLALLVMQEVSFRYGLGLTVANTFPLVVTAAIVERFSVNWEQQQLKATLKLAGWTILVAAATAVLLRAEWVLLVAERMPLVLVAAGAALSLAFGAYRGLRLTEIMRFQRAAGSEVRV